MTSGDRVARSLEVTSPSVDAAALHLLETDPAAYFEQTHRPLPLGLPAAATRRLASAMDTSADSSDTTDSPSDSVDHPHQSEPRFKSSRALRRQADRKLVRVAAAKQLGVSVTALAAQLRSAGITERLEPDQVNEWVAHPAAAPQWFAPALQRAREADAARLQPVQQSQPRGDRRQHSPSRDDGDITAFLAELRAMPVRTKRTRRRR